MNAFYDMNSNRTAAYTNGNLYYEGQTWSLLKVVSNEYRDALYNCFALSVQVHAYDKTWKKLFDTNDERLYVFMFNIMTEALYIKQQLENMIVYNTKQDYINYFKSLGNIIDKAFYYDAKNYLDIIAFTRGVIVKAPRPTTTPKVKTHNPDDKFYTFGANDYNSSDIVNWWDQNLTAKYEVTSADQVIDSTFNGVMNGLFNGVPPGDVFGWCIGNFTLARKGVSKLQKDWWYEEDFITSFDDIYDLLGLAYPFTWSCYYSNVLTIFNPYNLYLNANIIKNIQMNIPYIYTDITMLVLGVPGYTETDYIEYFFYYISDLVTRIYFRNELNPKLCWLAFEKC